MDEPLSVRRPLILLISDEGWDKAWTTDTMMTYGENMDLRVMPMNDILGFSFPTFDIFIGGPSIKEYAPYDFYAIYSSRPMSSMEIETLRALVRNYKDNVYPDIPVWLYNYIDSAGYIDIFEIVPTE